MIREAKRAAREILKRFGDTVPINIYDVVKAHKINLRSSSLDDEVSGWLVLEGDRAIIRVNNTHHANQQRFSIAHSLGHFILHKDQAKIFVEASVPLPEKSLTASKRQEMIADTFAAELLMPGIILKKEIGSRQLSAHDAKGIRQLAARFSVSEQLLTMQLIKLRLMKM